MTAGTVLLVLGAGAAGAVLRFLAARAGARSAWPWPVLAVNVVGSLAAGIGSHTAFAAIVVVGFAGGLTTFSTFSVETVQLALENRWRAAVGNVVANLALGLAAAAVGWMLGLALFG